MRLLHLLGWNHIQNVKGVLGVRCIFFTNIFLFSEVFQKLAYHCCHFYLQGFNLDLIETGGYKKS